MAGVNKVIIVGHLGNDPEIRTMPNGDAVANISVATSESWNDRNTGERREVTEWHRIVFYRRQAEICGEFLRKGSQIYVEGRLRTRKWQDQNGQDRYTTEIQGDVMQMLAAATKMPVVTQHRIWRKAHHNRLTNLAQTTTSNLPVRPRNKLHHSRKRRWMDSMTIFRFELHIN